jgi:hypothetical protein
MATAEATWAASDGVTAETAAATAAAWDGMAMAIAEAMEED